MKRTPLFITIVVIILTGGLVWFYQVSNSKKITPWDLIGSDAAIVFELNNVASFKEKLESIPPIKKIIRSNQAIKRMIELNSGKAYLSLHPISIDDFGILMYSEITKLNIDSNLFKAIPPEKIQRRLYNGIEINELLSESKILLSYAVIDNLILISDSSFLLEGALRLRSSGGDRLFKNYNSVLFKLPTLKSDEGNAYLNVTNFIGASKLFVQTESSKKSKFSLNGSSLTDLTLSDNRVLFNGFLVDGEDDLLALFKGQEPQRIDFDPFISNSVSAITHYGFSNNDLWFSKQQIFSESKNAKSTDSLEKELSRLSVSIESLRKSIGNQLTTCRAGKEGSEVTIVKLNETVGEISVFDELVSKVSTEKRDSLYVENYAGYQIKLIDYRNFLYQLFYPLSRPAEQSYFVRMGSHIILSEDVELIKLFINDIDNENTWGKSVDWNKFLTSSLQESNISLFFDGKLASVYLRNLFNAKWKGFFDSNSFLGIDKGAIQLSRLESNFYCNALFLFSEPETIKNNNRLESLTYDFGSTIVMPIAIVKSHLTKEIELIIQDTTRNLYLLTKNLKTQWKRSIDTRIVGDIDQIDFFSNSKLQYFFATQKSLHLIDRLGRNVDGFPKELNTGTFEYSAIVDYDRSKKYRYLMTDIKGNLFLTDKNASLLDGWSPRSLGGRMVRSAMHYRVLGKDYFVAIQQNGIASLMNRRGEMAKGFPLDLNIRPSGDFFLTVKNVMSSTHLTVVSNEGMKVEFGFDGQVRKREALIKRTGASKFSLVKSMAEDSFVFLRVDPAKLAILDTDGEVIFETENPGSTDWELSYLENRLKERFYCYYDIHQNFSYVYDGKGQLILSQPIESTQPPAMYYDEKLKLLMIYNVFNSKVSVISIKR